MNSSLKALPAFFFFFFNIESFTRRKNQNALALLSPFLFSVWGSSSHYSDIVEENMLVQKRNGPWLFSPDLVCAGRELARHEL